MKIPARWRMITEDDRAIVSFQCSGDGVDSCRAPASWVAERIDAEGRTNAIVTSRCPDHIPVRALQTLMPMPVVTREGIRSAMTNPPLAPSAAPDPLNDTNEGPASDAPIPNTSGASDAPVDPIAETQPSKSYKSPPPSPSSIPSLSPDDLDEDDA